jgi:hypothetical protein
MFNEVREEGGDDMVFYEAQNHCLECERAECL